MKSATISTKAVAQAEKHWGVTAPMVAGVITQRLPAPNGPEATTDHALHDQVSRAKTAHNTPPTPTEILT